MIICIFAAISVYIFSTCKEKMSEMPEKKKIAISLGDNCYPSQYGVSKGLRTTKKEGYNTCPFDLMQGNYNGMLECIRDDFKHFTDLEKITVIDDGYIVNPHYFFQFNHESPNQGHTLHIHEGWAEGERHFSNNNFKHFIERYNTRIQNFRDYLSDSSNHIIFIISIFFHPTLVPPGETPDFPQLKEALKIRYPHLSYEIHTIPATEHPNYDIWYPSAATKG